MKSQSSNELAPPQYYSSDNGYYSNIKPNLLKSQLKHSNFIGYESIHSNFGKKMKTQEANPQIPGSTQDMIYTPQIVSERSGSDYIKQKIENPEVKRMSSTMSRINSSKTTLQLNMRSQDFTQMAQRILGSKALTPSASYIQNNKSQRAKNDALSRKGSQIQLNYRKFEHQLKTTTEPNQSYSSITRTTSTPKNTLTAKSDAMRVMKRKAVTPQQQISSPILSIQRTQSTVAGRNAQTKQYQHHISATLAHLQKINNDMNEYRVESPKHSKQPSPTSSLSQFVTQVKMGSGSKTTKKSSHQIKFENEVSPLQSSSKPSDYVQRLISQQQSNQKRQSNYYLKKMRYYQHEETVGDPFQQIYREHFVQSFHSLGFCSVLQKVDPKAIKDRTVHLIRKPTLFNKTVVLDLDETLIHCNENTQMKSDVVLPIEFPNGEIINAGVNVRPYAIQLLQQLTSLCEVIVFTASHQCYASKVLEHLDPQNKLIHHRLFRDHCVTTEEGVHIKDLSILANRDLKDIVLVDNAAYSFGYQVDNGIPIIPFYDNKQDTELIDLLDYLKTLFTVPDVRVCNRKHFKMGQYSDYDNIDDAIEAVCQ